MRRRFMQRMGRPLRGFRGTGIPPLLLKSNQLLASGKYAEAADGFEELARAAENRGGPRAPQFYLEAGRARVLAGDTPQGVQLLDRGLRLLAASGASLRLRRAGRRIVAELAARGLDQEAEHIRHSLAEVGAETSMSAPEQSRRAGRPTLPVHCPACGAPVHPDEVDWLDDVTAECEYCGTPIRPE
jgi:hypothetical protein